MEKFGEYILTEKVGEGGMGAVFRAWKMGKGGFKKLIAVKRIRSELIGEREVFNMFIEEAHLTSRLDHDNIVKVFDFGEEKGENFLVMEYIKGVNLKEFIERTGGVVHKLDIPIALSIVQRVLEALDYALSVKDSSGRELKIVHRDVNPKNVLLTSQGGVKLTDFGIAKVARKKGGKLWGKPGYIPPEAITDGIWNERSDIYGVGLVLYELLTGEKAFKDNKKVLRGEVAPPSALNRYIPSSLDELVMRAISRFPEHRFQTPKGFLDAIDKLSDEFGYKRTESIRALLWETFGSRFQEEERKIAIEEAKIAADIPKARVFKRERSRVHLRIQILLGFLVGMGAGLIKGSVNARSINAEIVKVSEHMKEGRMWKAAKLLEAVFLETGIKSAAMLASEIWVLMGECRKAEEIAHKAGVEIKCRK